MYENRSNLIIGFHGCDMSVRNSLINKPNTLLKSEKPYDWLGHGIYFWENNYARALQWAKDKAKRLEIKKPAVIGAILSLDNCFDLVDTAFIELIKANYSSMVQSYLELGKELPKNRDIKEDQYKDKILRELDCAVIEYMHQKTLDQILADNNAKGYSDYKMFDSSRGVFTEGGPAFPGAGIKNKSHIQICVRNPNCIKGFFIPRNDIDFTPDYFRKP